MGGRARGLGRGEAHRLAAGLQGRRCAGPGQALCRGGSVRPGSHGGALNAGLLTGGWLWLLGGQGNRVRSARGTLSSGLMKSSPGGVQRAGRLQAGCPEALELQ